MIGAASSQLHSAMIGLTILVVEGPNSLLVLIRVGELQEYYTAL